MAGMVRGGLDQGGRNGGAGAGARVEWTVGQVGQLPEGG
eukprot:CAMPEP_0172036720 /NCGR_PEP_ID=MMETSP1041-20130122/22324_1 /TAXON_ID=464988 /ORGANISM="Hemiselmis andersenii, Strain CCMP439" /LENGTH=38 /DNA_ID= /DNA_START= /DNA_END= /DNA_ORIENTATION=